MATSTKSGTKPASKTAAKPKPAKSVAPAVKKPAVASKSVAAKKPAAKTTKAAKPSVHTGVSPEQRRYYVEVAAYYIAERRGFHGGSQLDDWVRAENEIDRLLRDGLIGS
jgi:hypothetical protein